MGRCHQAVQRGTPACGVACVRALWGPAGRMSSDSHAVREQAISRDGQNHVFFSNRSAAYLSQGAAASALSDARRVITLKPDWPKGYSRAGAALFSLKRYDESLSMYNDGMCAH